MKNIRDVPIGNSKITDLYDEVSEMLRRYIETFTFLVYIKEIPKEITMLYNVVFVLGDINLLNVLYKLYPDVFTENKLQDLSDNIIENPEDSGIRYPLDKYLWYQNKLGNEVTPIDLLNMMSTDNYDLAEEITVYLPEDLEIDMIISRIEDEIMNDSNRDIALMLYNKYHERLSRDALKRIIRALFN